MHNDESYLSFRQRCNHEIHIAIAQQYEVQFACTGQKFTPMLNEILPYFEEFHITGASFFLFIAAPPLETRNTIRREGWGKIH